LNYAYEVLSLKRRFIAYKYIQIRFFDRLLGSGII
jgi:hypothetical protein